MPTLNGVAYYTAADAKHYPGLVALVNSVRRLGETAPFFVVDCGLTIRQREAISSHVTVVAPRGELHPTFQKAIGPLEHPAEIMVVLDADVIVNRSLAPLFPNAMLGQIVAFEERISDRFFADWSVLGLGTPVRRPYVNGGHIIIPRSLSHAFLSLLCDLGHHIDIRSTLFGPRTDDDPENNPFFYADQDILNALLCTQYDGRVLRLDQTSWAYPPFSGLAMSRADGVWCEYADGGAPFILHHFWKKPWLSPMRPTVYTQVFTQLITAQDAALRLDAGDVPLRLSDSWLAPFDRWRASLQGFGHTHFRGKLGLRAVIERRIKKSTPRRS